MPRSPALTPAQDRQLRARVRAGADLPALVEYAKKHKIAASRATLGALLKSEREHPTAAAAEAVPTLDGLAERFQQLVQDVASLRGRLDGLISVPRVKLSEAANAAVDVARQILADPNVDPNAKAKVMAQLPDLIEAARKALETEQGGGDEELGE